MQQPLIHFAYVLFSYALVLWHPQGMAAINGRQQLAVTTPALLRQPSEEPTRNARQQDFWRAVRRELRWPIPKHPLVQKQLRDYALDTYHFNQVLSRATPYLGWIADKIRQQHMPMELLLLPMVESAFDPLAGSNKRAVGLWQITPETGRHYGLIQNEWYDGRRDVVHSTTAALKLLCYLNRRFEGDWLLTLAAYNGGETRVARAIRAQKAKRRGPIDFWSLHLPQETKVHTARLLALSAILKRVDHYGFKLPVIERRKMLTCVEASRPLALPQAAAMAGLPLATLKTFNPGHQQLASTPNGPQHLMLPRDRVARFKQELVRYHSRSRRIKRYTRAPYVLASSAQKKPTK